MTRLIIAQLVLSIALVVAGLLAVLIGAVVAIFVGSDWLLISAGGLLFVAAGVGFIVSQFRKFTRFFKQTFNSNTRTRIKR